VDSSLLLLELQAPRRLDVACECEIEL
jgi:hypothetical protein